LVLESMQEMAIGFQLNDPVVLARATIHLAGGDEGGDSRALEADISLVLTEGLGSGSFDPQAMSLMLDVMQRHGLEVPGAMTVLSRALLTLEGTLRTIDPSFNIAHEATALLPQLADQQSDMVQQQLQKELVRALPSLRTLPSNVEAIATQLRRGRLTMRVERFAGADRAVVDEWVDRIVFAAMGLLGMIASGVLLVAAALVRTDDDFATALQVIGFFGVVVTAVIQMRVVAQILRRGDAEGRRRV
jgi:ubiquinone biosynthesis protein